MSTYIHIFMNPKPLRSNLGNYPCPCLAVFAAGVRVVCKSGSPGPERTLNAQMYWSGEMERSV